MPQISAPLPRVTSASNIEHGYFTMTQLTSSFVRNLEMWFHWRRYIRRCERRRTNPTLHIVLLLVVVIIPAIALGQSEKEYTDQYNVRITGFWLYSYPTVTLQAAGHNGIIDFNHDFAFNQYSTFIGKADWKFTRRNHLYLSAAPFNQSNQAVLNRTITFRGQTFFAGATAKGQLQATLFAPGYQYDILQGSRGHLGFGVQVDIFRTTGSISAAAQITSTGVHQAATSSNASLLAPLPVLGPEFRLYLLKSPRIFLNGQVYGMYFFGYGNFISTTDYLGVAISKSLSINAGYTIGSRLRVNDTSNRAGLNLVQKGPIVGLDITF